MKTTFRFIIAAMAAIAVFSSCQKELANETANKTADGVRTISVQFDNSTKATLDGFAPKFANGDAIRVSNTEKSEECTVSVDGSDNATFTTTLSGALTAIYPSAAAVLSSGEADAPIATSNNIKVPASQDGTIAKAIIAKAEIAVGSTSATFTSQTALFQITPPAGATTFTITSLKPVVDGIARTGDAVAINTEGADDAAKRVINVTVPSDGTAYVALKAGVNLTDLSFDAGETYGMKGIPAKDIAAAGKTDATAANTKYTIGNTNWHPYVTIGGKKWATMNVGATSATDAGTYFMWGETTGLTSDKISSANFPSVKYYSADNFNTWSKSGGFCWNNCPWIKGVYKTSTKNVFTKYVPSFKSDYWGGTGSLDEKATLDLADDAAYANWGGPWRMPTGGVVASADFTALAKAAIASYTSGQISYTQTITTSGAPSDQGVYYYNVPGETVGVYFVDNSSKTLFFPAACFGYGTSLNLANSSGHYWSSSLSTSTPQYAFFLCCLATGELGPQNSNYRYYGFSVRPVSD